MDEICFADEILLRKDIKKDLISSEPSEDFIVDKVNDFIIELFKSCDIMFLRWYKLKENKLADLSMDFAVEILKLCDGLKGHYSIVNQLERSTTKKTLFDKE